MILPRADPRMVTTVAPFAILGFCLSNLFTSFGDSAVPFTGAEVDFLFYGPFSRRSLLGYKILKTSLGTAITTLIFSILLLRFCVSWIACCVGMWLTIQFMQLFAMAVIMVGQTVGERAYSGTRKILLIVAGVLVLLAIGPVLAAHVHSKPLEIMMQIHATIAGRILLVPFDVFAHAITARPSSLLQWAIPAIVINLVMLAVVIGLDANYLETAATASQRRYERRQLRPQRRDCQNERWERIAVPRDPAPALRRSRADRLAAAHRRRRSSRALPILLIIIGVAAGTFLLQQRGGSSSSLMRLMGTVAWMNVVFISMLKFDFRDELDRLDMLRSLPIRPIAVAAAELFTPVLVLTTMQASLLIVAAVSFKHAWKFVIPAAAFAVPFNVLHVGIENLLFLLFPLALGRADRR